MGLFKQMMKILLIEDDAQIADLVVSAFEALGIETQHEKDGFRGLRSALQLNFDAILLDVALPLMDGFQVLEEIRRNSLNTPVIMLTASVDLPDRWLGRVALIFPNLPSLNLLSIYLFRIDNKSKIAIH